MHLQCEIETFVLQIFGVKNLLAFFHSEINNWVYFFTAKIKTQFYMDGHVSILYHNSYITICIPEFLVYNCIFASSYAIKIFLQILTTYHIFHVQWLHAIPSKIIFSLLMLMWIAIFGDIGHTSQYLRYSAHIEIIFLIFMEAY